MLLFWLEKRKKNNGLMKERYAKKSIVVCNEVVDFMVCVMLQHSHRVIKYSKNRSLAIQCEFK